MSGGAILAWGYEGVEQSIELQADRTVFTVFEPDGRVRSGWPRGSVGAASQPVTDHDGSIAYVSARGKVWWHGPDGAVLAGWPYQLPTPAMLWMAPGSQLLIPFDDRVISLDRTGDMTDGWPVRLDRRPETHCLFGDTPCGGSIDPVIDEAGTIYLSLGARTAEHEVDLMSDAPGSIIAIAADGTVVDGWPVTLPERTHALDLSIEAGPLGGPLIASGVQCDPAGCGGDLTKSVAFVITRDGRFEELGG
jgi:hypothetical protein